MLGLFVQFGGVFYVDHVRFHLGQPYIRASTNALIVHDSWYARNDIFLVHEGGN